MHRYDPRDQRRQEHWQRREPPDRRPRDQRRQEHWQRREPRRRWDPRDRPQPRRQHHRPRPSLPPAPPPYTLYPQETRVCREEHMGVNLPAFDFESSLATRDVQEAAYRKEVECKHKKPVICQYWWRATASDIPSVGCMKGDACDFLHEVIPEKVPLCTHYLAGKCNRIGCIFRHAARQPCHAYERGFCKYGPKCVREHVKQKGPLCSKMDMYGRCPDPTCTDKHPRMDDTFNRELWAYYQANWQKFHA